MRHVTRIGVRLVIVVGCGLGVVQLVVSALSLQVPSAYDKDFGQEYLLARVLLDRGIDPYRPLHEVAEHYLGSSPGFFDKAIPTPHPLTAGLLILPLGLLSYVAAVRVWFVVQLVSLVATMFLAARLAQFRIGLLPLAAITLLASTWDPVAQDLGLGQVTLQIVVLLLLAEWYWTRKRPALAGVLFGLSLLIKPLAWPWFLVMLRHGDWRAMAGSVGTVVVGYGLVALRLGPAPIVDYVRRVLPEISAGYVSEPTNTSVWVIGPRLFQSSPTTAAVVSGALVAALLGAVWWAAAPKRPLSYALSMATAVSTIVNPISWLYYLVLTIQPGAHVLAYLRNAGWPRAATIAAIGVGVWLSVLWRTWYALGSRDPLFGTGPTGAAIALVVFLVAIAPCAPGDR